MAFTLSTRLGLFLFLALFGSAFRLSAASTKTHASSVFDVASDSVVVVSALDENGAEIGQGSGIVLSDSTVVTSLHVVRTASGVRLSKGGFSIAARVSLFAEESDLALLVAKGHPWRAAQVQGTPPRVGADVYAIGAPRGLELSITEGIVSSVRLGRGVPWIQTTAAISPGSSGGGLFDRSGHLVGVTSWQLSNSQNLNFAVSATAVTEIARTGRPFTELGRGTSTTARKPYARTVKLVEGRWYMFSFTDEGIRLLDPKTFQIEGPVMTYDVVMMFFKGGNRGEVWEGRAGVNCDSRAVRQIGPMNVHRYRQSEIIRQVDLDNGWQQVPPGSALGRELEIGCLYHADPHHDLFIDVLSELHDGIAVEVTKPGGPLSQN